MGIGRSTFYDTPDARARDLAIGDPRIARGSDSLARSGVCGCCKPRR
jgi:hypothetical protein